MYKVHLRVLVSILNFLLLLSIIVCDLVGGVSVKGNLAVPWINKTVCGLGDVVQGNSSHKVSRLCDSDRILPDLQRIITNDLLQECFYDSAKGTTFTLLLADSIKGNGVGSSRNQNTTKKTEQLLQKAVKTYNLTEESSAIFLLVVKENLQMRDWLSDSLVGKFKSVDRQEVLQNLTLEYNNNKGHFPTVVNKLVYFYCQIVEAPPYKRAKWDALTYLWMILVIVLISAVTATVIHLIMVRYKAFHSGPRDGKHLRATSGRPNLGPLSMEMDDFGTTPFEPSGNLLLSSFDVAAVPQPHSSTANLLEP